MPWFMWMLLIIAAVFIVLGVWAEMRYKKHGRSGVLTDSDVGLACIPFLIAFIAVAAAGYAAEHNHFLKMHHMIEGSKHKIVVLEEQESFVISAIRIEVAEYLQHEGKALGDLKIDRENVIAVLTQYPQLRSSEVVSKYLVSIESLRKSITEEKKLLFDQIADYNWRTKAAFRKHFLPGHLPERIKYN